MEGERERREERGTEGTEKLEQDSPKLRAFLEAH